VSQNIFEQSNPTLQVSETFISLDAPQCENARKLLAFWQARPEDGLVFCRDLPSSKIASLLSNIIVWEPVGMWENARVRLMGNALWCRFGNNIKGKLLTELFPPAEVPQHLGLLRRSHRTNAPVMVQSHLLYHALEVMRLEIIVMPMKAANRSDMMALAGVFATPTGGATDALPKTQPS
jgi:hypothetical protein